MLLVVCGCDRSAHPKPATRAVAVGPRDVARVRTATVESGPTLTGTLTAQKVADVRAEISGSVLATSAEPGQRVTAGETLARINPAAAPKQLSAAQSALVSATRAYQAARKDEARTRTLVKAGSLARKALSQAVANTAAAKAQLAKARADFAAAGTQLSHTDIIAPFSGVVSQRAVSRGDIVQPGTLLFTVVDPSTLILEASVPVESLGSLAVGDPVELTVTGYGGEIFQAEVTRINPVVDPSTGQVRVYAEIPNRGGALLSGLYAQGRVVTSASKGTSVPTDALVNRDVAPEVVRISNGVLERVPVKVLAEDRLNGRALVSGVGPGDVVALGSLQELPDGTRVHLEKPTSPGPEGIGGSGPSGLGARAPDGGLRPGARPPGKARGR